MEYRGVEFSIVQMIPNGWKWVVRQTPQDKEGKSINRNAAILRAQKAIDDLLRKQSPEAGE